MAELIKNRNKLRDWLGAPYNAGDGKQRIRRELANGVEEHYDVRYGEIVDDALLEEIAAELLSCDECTRCGGHIPVRRLTCVNPDGRVAVIYDEYEFEDGPFEIDGEALAMGSEAEVEAD